MIRFEKSRGVGGLSPSDPRNWIPTYRSEYPTTKSRAPEACLALRLILKSPCVELVVRPISAIFALYNLDVPGGCSYVSASATTLSSPLSCDDLSSLIRKLPAHRTSSALRPAGSPVVSDVDARVPPSWPPPSLSRKAEGAVPFMHIATELRRTPAAADRCATEARTPTRSTPRHSALAARHRPGHARALFGEVLVPIATISSWVTHPVSGGRSVPGGYS